MILVTRNIDHNLRRKKNFLPHLERIPSCEKSIFFHDERMENQNQRMLTRCIFIKTGIDEKEPQIERV